MAFIFTNVSLASVMVPFVTLSSLKKIFNEDSSSLGMTSLIITSYNNAKTINRSRIKHIEGNKNLEILCIVG